METKTAQAIALFTSGNIAGSLKIFSKFRIGFTKDEIRTLEIARESMTGNESFYQAIKVDTAVIKQQAVELIKEKYNL